MMVFAFSFRGDKNKKQNNPCQDAVRVEHIDGETFIAALADGCSGSCFSDVGANANVLSVCEYFKSFDDPKTPFTIKPKKLAADIIEYCCNNIAKWYRTKQLEKYSSTLLLMYVHKRRVIIAHIGDGVIAALKNNGEGKIISGPENIDGIANRTYFVDSRDALQKMKVYVFNKFEYDSIIMTSDGPYDAFNDRGIELGFLGTYREVLDIVHEYPPGHAAALTELLIKNRNSFKDGQRYDDWSVVMYNRDEYDNEMPDDDEEDFLFDEESDDFGIEKPEEYDIHFDSVDMELNNIKKDRKHARNNKKEEKELTFIEPIEPKEHMEEKKLQAYYSKKSSRNKMIMKLFHNLNDRFISD